VVAIHAAANTVTYLVRRPWWDRIQAIQDAGRIPGIEKLLSPEWPALFYFPRDVASEATKADAASIGAATRGLHVIGVALDWDDFSPLTRNGFKCAAVDERPPGPRAYRCARRDQSFDGNHN
jgi:hypothetical protein